MTLYKKIIFLILPFIISLSFAQTTHVLSVDTKLKRLPFGLTEQVPTAIPTVALALSGGGARGVAQVGVIKALIDANIPIDIIAGTSIGSIIGGLYASGYSIDQLDSIILNTGWDALLASDRETNRRELFVDQKITEDKEIFALRLQGLKPVLPTALNNGQKISNYLNLLTFQAPIHSDSNFDELRVKFRAVCTDLVTGQPVILGRGSLSQAMRASSSVSFFLSPLKYDSLLLVDGGLVANIPVKIVSDLGGQYVIAVKTTSDLHPEGELALPWDVADQTISIPMRLLNNAQLNYANHVIVPDLDDIAINDFSNVDSLVLKGYQSALTNISGIKLQIDSLFKKNLGVNTYYIKNVLFDSGADHINRPILQNYSMRDSVSNIDILKDICTLYTTGIYKNITANIIQYPEYSVVKFAYEYNPSIKYIAVQGITLINKQLVDSLLNKLVDHPYNAENLVSELIQVLNLYRAKGYCLANIDNIKFNSNTGKLNLIFDEGKINSVVTEGNKYTNSYIITRELPVKVGDYFNFNNVQQGLINLRATNLFDDILLTVKREDKKNIIVIRVTEVAESLVRVGFKIDNENNAQLSLDLVDENLFGSGSELGLLLLGSSKGRAFSLEDRSYRIFNTYLTYKLNAFYNFNDIYTYTEAASTSSSRFSLIQNGLYRQIFYGGSVSLGTQVERWGNVIFEGKYQFNQVEKIQDQTQIDPYFIKIVSLKVSTTVDTQDKYPYPMRGIYFKGEYESALPILGGNIGYTNFDFDYKSYFTLNRMHTFSPQFLIGFASNTLPTAEEYSLGGQSSFFGMRNDEFRGRQIFLTSFEYRYKFPFQIFFDTYFKLRYDLGSTWPTQQAFRFKDLRHGIGTTLSFDTPIGPADFAVGKSFKFVKNLPGNPLSFGDTFVYFSIGYYY